MDYFRERKSVFFILIIVFIIIIVSIMVAFSLRTDPVSENLEEDQVIKILFVLNDGDGNALATDVFVYYPKSNKGALFNILGNTGKIYNSINRTDRIDAVYKEKGIEVYCQEISSLVDLMIPFTIEINADDFAQLVDLMGGLKLFVPSPVDAVDEKTSVRWLLPSGAVTLDGDKVKTYMDYLLPEETFSDKDDRRQNVVVSFLSSLKENRQNILDKSIFSFFGEKMKANIDSNGLYKLFEVISSVESDSITTQSITGSLRNVDGKMLLFPYYDGQLIKDVVKQKIRMLVEDDGEQTRVYVIDILNGTPKQGLARNAAVLLQNTGYNILQTANADRNDYEHTAIINHIGNTDAAKVLGNFIRCYNIIDSDLRSDDTLQSDADADFTLILGDDWDGRYVRGGFGKEEEQEQPVLDTSGEEQENLSDVIEQTGTE